MRTSPWRLPSGFQMNHLQLQTDSESLLSCLCWQTAILLHCQRTREKKVFWPQAGWIQSWWGLKAWTQTVSPPHCQRILLQRRKALRSPLTHLRQQFFTVDYKSKTCPQVYRSHHLFCNATFAYDYATATCVKACCIRSALHVHCHSRQRGPVQHNRLQKFCSET